MLAPIIAAAREAGEKATLRKKKIFDRPQQLSHLGLKVPETEEERIALCSVIKNGKKILRMTDPNFF